MARSKQSRHFKLSDTLGAAQIISKTTLDVMHTTEQMHLSITERSTSSSIPMLRSIHPVTMFVYGAVKLAPKLSGLILSPVAKHLSKRTSLETENASNERLGVLSVLNGVAGDQMAATHNPLCIEMSWITQQATTDSANNLVLFVHGLCMNEQAWPLSQTSELAQQLDATPVYLRYNTGLPLSLNGELLCSTLATLVKEKNLTGKKVYIVGHSMGGLIAYRALEIAESNNLPWLRDIASLVCLGTPHGGASLAHIAHWVESQMGRTRFLMPIKALTQQRSAGIKDLQHGSTHHQTDQLPFPVFCLAGELTEKNPFGDGLVSVESATALADLQDAKTLSDLGHLGLLTDPRVYDQLKQWLTTGRG